MNTAKSPLRTLLVDDERLACKLMAELLLKHPELEVVAQASSVEEASVIAAQLDPQIVFLDVQMPGRSGFELLPHLEKLAVYPLIVFLTAHEDYAVRAFESAALDYLLKPVHPDRLARTVGRLLLAAANLESQPAKPDRNPDKVDPLHTVTRLEADDVEVVRDGKSTRLVKPSQIRAIQTEGSYTRLLLDAGISIMVKLPLSYWESRLPEGLFIKASRSMLLNIKSICQLQSYSRDRTHLFLAGISQPLVLSRLESLRVRREL